MLEAINQIDTCLVERKLKEVHLMHKQIRSINERIGICPFNGRTIVTRMRGLMNDWRKGKAFAVKILGENQQMATRR